MVEVSVFLIFLTDLLLWLLGLVLQTQFWHFPIEQKLDPSLFFPRNKLPFKYPLGLSFSGHFCLWSVCWRHGVRVA